MADFHIIIPKETILYKGIKGNDLVNKLNSSCWFAFDENVAESYAITYAESSIPSELFKFELKQEIKLINILSLKFKIDFWDRCNMLYTKNNLRDPIKSNALIALGIPNIDTQQLLMHNVVDCDDQTKAWGNLLGGHRCSSPIGDIELIRAMKDIYKEDYDGYVQIFNVPTCFHDGKDFPREICIFSCINRFDNITLIKQFIKKPLEGGSIINKNLLDREELTIDDWRKTAMNSIKACGYKGKILYDKNNIPLPLGYDVIMKDREKQKIKENKKKLKESKLQKNLGEFKLTEDMQLIRIN